MGTPTDGTRPSAARGRVPPGARVSTCHRAASGRPAGSTPFTTTPGPRRASVPTHGRSTGPVELTGLTGRRRVSLVPVQSHGLPIKCRPGSEGPTGIEDNRPLWVTSVGDVYPLEVLL